MINSKLDLTIKQLPIKKTDENHRFFLLSQIHL